MAGNSQWSGEPDVKRSTFFTKNPTTATKSTKPLQQYGRKHNSHQHGQGRKDYSVAYSHKFFPDTPCKLIDFVGGPSYDPSQDDGVIFNRVVSFFRNITNTIESVKGMEHFSLSIVQSIDRFYVGIVDADESRKPPIKTLNCISCDVKSETNKISRINYPPTARETTTKLHNIWIDAKARPMFVITPVRHVERLSGCTDEEVFSMFSLAVQVLYEEVRASKAPWRDVRFTKMILNHGNCRNVEHLHLKIRMPGEDFRYYVERGWDEAKKQKLEILKSGLYKRDERLKKIN
ncbi:2116_t:CDS:1 [Acaulospora colombiana]|uniref:2116_t:CDS:1 n=1 Tax=Acaulospora colombiana TaxID=27376 RepID=A0ACA9LIQ2_9GLOM|nr:2116_t:CDS:1 [Acaulospora colombiana]